MNKRIKIKLLPVTWRQKLKHSVINIHDICEQSHHNAKKNHIAFALLR